VEQAVEVATVEPHPVVLVVKTMPHRETPSALVMILVAHHLASEVKPLQVLDLQTLTLAIEQLFKRVRQTPIQIRQTIVKLQQLITLLTTTPTLLHRHLQQVPVVLPHPHLQQVAMRQHLHLHLQRRVEHLASKRLDQRQRQRPMQLQQDHRLR
jgi:hypothetical protein